MSDTDNSSSTVTVVVPEQKSSKVLEMLTGVNAVDVLNQC